MLEASATRIAHLYNPGRLIAAMVAGSGIQLEIGGWKRDAEIPLEDIYPFPIHELVGHTPTLTLWRRGEVGVLVFNGRFHLYQGYSAAEVAAIPRLSGLLGAPIYLATNAAGALNLELATGSIVVIRDHLNLQGVNALVGDWGRWRGQMFPDMVGAYDGDLRSRAIRHATAAGFGVTEGVYVGLLGPNYETPAEVRMLADLGGTVVGMSTVQEVLAARQLGMRVLVLSLVTNLAAGLSGTPLTHLEVLEAGKAARSRLADLLERLVADFSGDES